MYSNRQVLNNEYFGKFILVNQKMENDIIEKLKKRFNFSSDKAVADHLKISKQNLSDYKSGRRDLSIAAKIRAWDSLGYAITRDMLLSLLGDEGKRIIEIDNERAADRAKRAAEKANKNGDQETN